jgi:proteasome activator subunit 4
MAPESGTLFDWQGKDVLAAIERVLTPDHWEAILKHLAQEKDRVTLSNETMILIKSIFQVFGISQLANLQEHITRYIAERDRHKHRAAAEILAGIQRGSKHWVQKDVRQLWSWLDDILPKILAECTPDSQPAWQGSVEFMLQQRDPRRALSLVEMIVKAAKDAFSSSQSPWEQAKAHTMLRGVLLALELKSYAWTPALQQLYSQNFETDFEEVRGLIASNMTDMKLLDVAPSFASVEELMKTCAETDESGQLVTGSIFVNKAMENSFSRQLNETTDLLAQLRTERVSKSQGTSRYDLLASTELTLLAEMLRDHRRNAMSLCAIDFIPTIFECCNLNDNVELTTRARNVLVGAVSTTAYFDVANVERITKKVLEVIEQSQDSWRARLDALPVLQIVYFQNLFYMDSGLVGDIVQALIRLLSDPHLEVRSAASVTLSGIVRCSERTMIQELRQKFTQQVAQYGARLPKRGAAHFQERLTQLHAGILGAVALISAFPYSVPAWMPALICDTVARFQDAPDPVGPACKKLAADFKRTHQDTWEEDKDQFNSDQLAEYYEWGGRTDYYA